MTNFTREIPNNAVVLDLLSKALTPSNLFTAIEGLRSHLDNLRSHSDNQHTQILAAIEVMQLQLRAVLKEVRPYEPLSR